MLDNIVRAAARGARPGDGGTDERICQIIVQGPLGAHPEQVLTKLIEAIEQRATISVNRQTQTQAGRPLQDYQWNLQLAEDGRPTGRINLRLPSLAELERVRPNPRGHHRNEWYLFAHQDAHGGTGQGAFSEMISAATWQLQMERAILGAKRYWCGVMMGDAHPGPLATH